MVNEVLDRGKYKLVEFRAAAVETANQWATGARDAVSTAAKRTQETIGPVAESVRRNPWPAVLIGAGATWLIVERARSGGRDASQAQTRAGDVKRFVQQNPLLAGAAAVGLGVAFGLALPGTQRENALFGDARDAFVQRARRFARDAIEALQGVGDSVHDLTGHTS